MEGCITQICLTYLALESPPTPWKNSVEFIRITLAQLDQLKIMQNQTVTMDGIYMTLSSSSPFLYVIVLYRIETDRI